MSNPQRGQGQQRVRAPGPGQAARARIAAQQAEQRRKDRRRRLLAFGSVGLALLAVLGIIIAALVSHSSSPGRNAAAGSQPLPASVQPALTIPPGTLAAVGAGSSTAGALKPVTGPALTSGGKPEMLYIGAEWCPYCAAERWAMAVALSRFGHFTPLQGVHSSASDVYPSTSTLTFHNATYTSQYLTFAGVETEDTSHASLQAPTHAQQALWTKYDPPGDSFPFIDIGNRFVASTTYSPQVLHGLSWSQIATDLHNPRSAVAKGAVGSANLLTAAICRITGNAPASVCTTAPIPSIEHRL